MNNFFEITNVTLTDIASKYNRSKGVEILEFKYFYSTFYKIKKSYRCDFYTFIYVQEDAGYVTIDFKEYALKKNHVYFINYNQIHIWSKCKKTKGLVIAFTEEFYNIIFTGNEKIKCDLALQEVSPVVEISNDNIRERELLLNQFFSNAQIENNDEVLCLLLKVLVLKYTRYEKSVLKIDTKVNRKYEIVSKYKVLVNQHFCKLKLPKDYAILLNITANYLNAICKNITGNSARKIINHRIIVEAQRYLLHSDLNINEIAFELGFIDKSHFSKYFKNHTKNSPLSYRIANSNLKKFKHRNLEVEH
jgi:AraC-like DNA-binding protein